MHKNGPNGGDAPVDGAQSSASLSTEAWRSDFVFDALNHRRRRYVCGLLREEDGRTLEELAMDIAKEERRESDREVTNYEWEKVYAALYHAHIPKLVKLNVVSLDPDTETVSSAGNFAPVSAALAAVERVLGRDSDDGVDEDVIDG